MDLLKDHGVSYLEIFYDELSNQEIDPWIKIIQFLDPSIKSDEMIHKKTNQVIKNPIFKKTTILKHYDLITNYDEVLATLKDTEFEKYIHKKE